MVFSPEGVRQWSETELRVGHISEVEADFHRGVLALWEENARLVEERQAAWECAKRTRHERDEARKETDRWKQIPEAMRENGFPKIGDTPIAVTTTVAMLAMERDDLQERVEELERENASLAQTWWESHAAATMRKRAEAAESEVARLREMPPPVCTGSGTVPVDAQVSYSTLPTEGRCGICGQMAPLANSTNVVLATHPFRAARGE